MNLDDPQERSATAGEYVLGTLDAAARSAFEHALLTDRGLQAEVYAWQDRLLGLALKIAPVEPSAAAWPAIEQRVAAAAGGRAAAGMPGRRADKAANDSFWQRLTQRPLGPGLAIAASLVLATVLLLRLPTLQPAAPRYLAVLQSPSDQSAGWVVEAMAGGSLRLVPIGSTPPVPSGKVLQFWTKAEGASGPTSLGLVTAGQAVELPVSQLPTLEARQLFELTLEPEGGSTIGRPTGPIVYLGRTVLL